MIRKNADGVYQSSLFTHLGVVHGYSNRRFGDMRDEGSRGRFLKTLGLKNADTVMGEQIHGIEITKVEDTDRGRTLKGIDGLMSKTPGTILGVTFADCVPILAIDTKANIVGTAHAGWKGTLAGIARELVTKMEHSSASARDIYISIGPHIGMCSYNVPEDRVIAFQKIFGTDERITSRLNGQWHLDIGYANYQVLMDAGVKKEHIDAPPTCTACQVSEFNSFRADPKDQFGLQLGVITL